MSKKRIDGAPPPDYVHTEPEVHPSERNLAWVGDLLYVVTVIVGLFALWAVFGGHR